MTKTEFLFGNSHVDTKTGQSLDKGAANWVLYCIIWVNKKNKKTKYT